MKLIKNYKYKHLTLFLISILIAISLSQFALLDDFFFSLRHVQLLGPFLAGILYVSAPTAALGILILFDLTQNISIIELAILAAIGGVIGDLIIFRFFKSQLLEELTLIYYKIGGSHITKIFNHKYLRWSIPIIGTFIIASPLPDELGVGLMGITKIKTYQFMIISFVLDIMGIFLLLSAYLIVK